MFHFPRGSLLPPSCPTSEPPSQARSQFSAAAGKYPPPPTQASTRDEKLFCEAGWSPRGDRPPVCSARVDAESSRRLPGQVVPTWGRAAPWRQRGALLAPAQVGIRSWRSKCGGWTPGLPSHCASGSRALRPTSSLGRLSRSRGLSLDRRFLMFSLGRFGCSSSPRGVIGIV